MNYARSGFWETVVCEGVILTFAILTLPLRKKY
jgi:hypothetical protein